MSIDLEMPVYLETYTPTHPEGREYIGKARVDVGPDLTLKGTITFEPEERREELEDLLESMTWSLGVAPPGTACLVLRPPKEIEP